MSSIEEFIKDRLIKLEKLKENGMDPYPAECLRDHSMVDFLASFDDLLKNEIKVTLAGRVMSFRVHGNSAFLDLYDGTERVQAFFKKDIVGAEKYKLFVDTVDQSDFLEVSGLAYVTNTGQNSLVVHDWKMLSKSIRAVPSSWYGIKDEDERYRKRYLDILLDKDLTEMVKKRSIFWNSIRKFLLNKSFVEVETPVLENTTGGADARPFVTHHNALDIDVFLRISAGELWQKKLLVAGIPKTFEIGRIFRNEGMSNEHLQDYTQMEFYMAYSDYLKGMEMIKELYRFVAKETFGTTKFSIKGFDIDLEKEWQTYDFVQMIKDEFGIDALNADKAEIEEKLKEKNIAYDQKDINKERGIDLLWKSLRKNISGPGFLINVPVFLEPLAKRNRNNPQTVERFQVILAGSEMGKGFSELNDPMDQRERFMVQQRMRDAGDEEAQMADMDFIEALEYGMPPAFGFGLSERLFSFLMDKSVRESQLFPLLKPRDEENK